MGQKISNPQKTNIKKSFWLWDNKKIITYFFRKMNVLQLEN